MLTAKIALAAALTLASGAAFAASGQRHDRVDLNRVAVERMSMDRTIVDGPRSVTGRTASEPTIFGHAPLGLHYDLPRHNGS